LPAQLVDYIADHRNELRWNAEMVTIERLDSGPLRAGARFADTARAMGMRFRARLELVELAPERLVRFRGATAIMSLETAYAVAAHPEGSRLVFDFTAVPRLLARPLRSWVQREMDRRFDTLIPALCRAAEASAAPA
jgi:hypothetical protein